MRGKIKAWWGTESAKRIRALVWSVGATVVFNAMLQLVVYPSFERKLGAQDYGVALSAISFVAIVAGSCGYAINCTRLLGVKDGRDHNGDYNLILLIAGVMGALIGMLYLRSVGVFSLGEFLIFGILLFATMLRYYSEVEFRLSTNFFRYMIYYLLISLGYLLGLVLFGLGGTWMTALLVGEALAVLFVVIFGSIYRAPLLRPSKHFALTLRDVGFVFFSTLIDNLTLHADRILLLWLTGDGAAVTTAYIASLTGKIVAMLTVPINAILLSYLVRYREGLGARLWGMILLGVSAFGALAFVGCLVISPPLISLLYPDTLAAVRPYLVWAILGQIFYFASSVLMVVLLRFLGERRQLIFNATYAVLFFACVGVGTARLGLDGFFFCSLLANGIRFFGAVIWGFLPFKRQGEKPCPD